MGMTRAAAAALLGGDSRPEQLEALLRGAAGNFTLGIPRAENAGPPRLPEPVGVSIDDDIARLIRKFPRLRAVFHAYRKRREKRIRDLHLAREERDRLLYQILAIEKAGKHKNGWGR